MSSSVPARPEPPGRNHPEAHPEVREVRAVAALVDGADAEQPALGRGLLARREPVVAGRGRDDDAAVQRPVQRSVERVAAAAEAAARSAQREVDDVRAVVHGPVDALGHRVGVAVSVVVEHPDGEDLRARRDRLHPDAVATERGAITPATWVPCPLPSWAVSSLSMKSCPGRTWPARSAWSAFTPVSTTATTAPAPVLVARAPSAPIMSRPHWCERSGSAACAVAGAAKHGRCGRPALPGWPSQRI